MVLSWSLSSFVQNKAVCSANSSVSVREKCRMTKEIDINKPATLHYVDDGSNLTQIAKLSTMSITL